MTTVTIAQVMQRRPCFQYAESRVADLFAGRETLSALDVIALDIPAADRLWACLHEDLVDERTLRLFACDCAERALIRERDAGREPDARNFEAIAVSRRYAAGDATGSEMAAAWDSAWDAAWDASRAAAWDSAWDAAWDASRAAARAAAWDAARAASRSAARAAARAAAWDAARAAAWDASRAAARAAAWDAARAAARDAEAEWQVEHLRSMLGTP
jgi:hypothetical protein